MPAGGESERGILGEQALVWRKAAKRQPLMGMVQRQLELPAAPAVCRARGLGREPQTDLPEQLAPRQAEGIATADPHERFDGRSFELGRRAADEIAHALESAVAFALRDGGDRGFFTPVANESQANSERGRFPFPIPRFPFNRAPDIAHIDIRQPQLDAVAHRIAPQRVERVEAHRLIIEERDVVLDRVIVPEPRRLVGEQAERRSVRLGESELTERDHLAEDFLCRGFGDAAGDGTVTKFLPKAGDEIVRAAAAHGATQRLGLAGRESRECLADLQHLILIENDTKRFGEALAEQGVVHGWVVRLAGRVRAALCFAPAHVRVHRAADDRPRPHDGDLDGEIFEVAWPATPDHLDLRATLDLEQADRVAGADAIVNRGILEIDA